MKNRQNAWILFLFCAFAFTQARAQYMPVVFDKQYGDKNQIQLVSPLTGDEVALVGKEGQKYNLTWIGREGDVIFSLPLTGFTLINEITEIDNNRILLVGQSEVIDKKSKKNNITVSGRILVVDRNGSKVTDIFAGGQGCDLRKGVELRNGTYIVAGSEPASVGTRRGIILKVDNTGRVIYEYKNNTAGYCAHFSVLGNTTEYICAAFSGDKDKEKASVVRLDDKGKPYYTTELPAKRFSVTAIEGNINDGSLFVVGNSPVDGGILYKIRPEGDIVFEKTFIPADQGVASFPHLKVARNGNVLIGGSGNKGYYALLRNDGTALYTGTANGKVAGVGMNTVTGESVITTYSLNSRRGTLVRIHANGKAEFDLPLDGHFDNIRVTHNGEALLLSSSEGRVCMFSSTGIREFDRYITDNKPTVYRSALCAASGELLFLGSGSRLVKLGHGLYVSDVKITKPVNGTATAVFTVTLTGFATTPQGAPVPVSVAYATREASANTSQHFTPVQGRLSFTPSPGSAGGYLAKQEIEVPIKANNLVEGEKSFELTLSDVSQSYLVKPSGKAIIEDQQAVVKLIRTEQGVEGASDIVYELGLFKTNGTPLTNATGANIIVDGVYGQGTADALDFDMGLTPRVVIPNGAGKSSFHVKTLEDTRYELPKTVVVNFDKIHSLSGSNVSFEGELLSCSGTVIDQPARLAITSLGDHRVNNNVVSGFFTVSLLRASDGALQTNATGNDIVVNCVAAPDASAKEGKDFVFTNLYDLRIVGDGNHGTANINGVVLYSTDSQEKSVKVKIKSVTQPSGAQPIRVDAAEAAAQFSILK